MEAPPGCTRCSANNSRSWRCPVIFPTEYRNVKGVDVVVKTCPKHRAKYLAHSKTPKGRASAARFRKTDKFKKSHDEHTASDKAKATLNNWNQSPAGKASNSKKQKRYGSTEAGKVKRHGYARQLSAQMSSRMNNLVNGTAKKSKLLKMYSEFKNEAQVKEHMSSTFEPWMNFSNHGRLLSDTKPKTVWQVGHRIPIAAYDYSDEEDIRRCWKRVNLFAQCARENATLKKRLPSKEILLSLRHIWPVAWKDQLPASLC